MEIRQARDQLTNLRRELVLEICHDEAGLQLALAQTDQIAQRYQLLAYLMGTTSHRIQFVMPIGHA